MLTIAMRLLPAFCLLLCSSLLSSCGEIREGFIMLAGWEQTVSREELLQIYVTRTVNAAYYRGSDEQFDYFTVFGMRYAVPRSENVMDEQYRFPAADGRTALPMGMGWGGARPLQFRPQEQAAGFIPLKG